VVFMQRKKALRLKRKIKIATMNDQGPYRTTKKEINFWFNYINNQMFDNRLPHFDRIVVKKWLKEAIGQVVSYPDKNPTRFDLEMLKKYSSKKEFIDTLAHEMVHLYQMYCRKDTGAHNKLFYSFKPKFKFLGLEL